MVGTFHHKDRRNHARKEASYHMARRIEDGCTARNTFECIYGACIAIHKVPTLVKYIDFTQNGKIKIIKQTSTMQYLQASKHFLLQRLC